MMPFINALVFLVRGCENADNGVTATVQTIPFFHSVIFIDSCLFFRYQFFLIFFFFFTLLHIAGFLSIRCY